MMMNKSAPVCSAAYSYSCGTYNAQYTTNSLFTETQLLVAHNVKAREPGLLPWVAAEIEGLPVVANATVMAALGMHGCVDIDIDPDYTDKAVVGLYLSAPCIEACPVVRHPHAPTQVSQADLDRLPASIRAITSVAVGAGVRVWWLPPNETVLGLGRWLDLHCGEVTPESQWNRTVDSLSAWGAALDYYRMSTHLGGPNIDSLIVVIRKMLADYFLSEAPFLASDTHRAIFARRVMTIPVHYGDGTNSIDPLCSVGTPLLRCMTDRWAARMEAIRTRAMVNSTWCMSGLEVNAYYSPLSDAVRRPPTLCLSHCRDPSPLSHRRWFAGVHSVCDRAVAVLRPWVAAVDADGHAWRCDCARDWAQRSSRLEFSGGAGQSGLGAGGSV